MESNASTIKLTSADREYLELQTRARTIQAQTVIRGSIRNGRIDVPLTRHVPPRTYPDFGITPPNMQLSRIRLFTKLIVQLLSVDSWLGKVISFCKHFQLLFPRVASSLASSVQPVE
jgi:hypothetical protein